MFLKTGVSDEMVEELDTGSKFGLSALMGVRVEGIGERGDTDKTSTFHFGRETGGGGGGHPEIGFLHAHSGWILEDT
jgi:hypothetical protein